ncbi:hypothetical protein Q9L58_010925, partial [Maublancomyces gigas]
MPPKGKDKQKEEHYYAPANKFTHGKGPPKQKQKQQQQKQQQQPYTPGKAQFLNPDGTPTASEGDSTSFVPIIYQRRADSSIMRDNLGSPTPVRATPPPPPQTPTPNIPILSGSALAEAWDMPYDPRLHSGPKTPGNPLTLNDKAYSAYLQGLTP